MYTEHGRRAGRPARERRAGGDCHGLQLQSLLQIPTAAVSQHMFGQVLFSALGVVFLVLSSFINRAVTAQRGGLLVQVLAMALQLQTPYGESLLPRPYSCRVPVENPYCHGLTAAESLWGIPTAAVRRAARAGAPPFYSDGHHTQCPFQCLMLFRAQVLISQRRPPHAASLFSAPLQCLGLLVHVLRGNVAAYSCTPYGESLLQL